MSSGLLFNAVNMQRANMIHTTAGASSLLLPPPAANHQLPMIMGNLPQGAHAAMVRAVHERNDSLQPTNTDIAYDPKKEEFLQFCDILFGHLQPEYRRSVTPEKAYMFCWYQAFRSKRTAKRRNNRQTSNNLFDYDDYKQVCSKWGGLGDGEIATRNTTAAADSLVSRVERNDAAREHPVDGLKYDCVNQYVCAVRKVFLDQQSQGANSYQWSMIRNDNISALLQYVKKRVPAVNRMNHAEKIENDFAPYLYAEKVNEIEFELFQRNGGRSPIQTLASLRNRFVFLQTTRAILRAESVFKADLSDCLGITIHPEREPHPMFISILQIPEGKINHDGRKLYGRALRHINPESCAVGALGFYLMYRFYVSSEMNPPPDFANNAAWFDIKLLVDAHCTRQTAHSPNRRGSNTKAMDDAHYGNVIKDVCKKLEIPQNKQLHIGRVIGVKVAELEELAPDLIKNIGNWDVEVLEKFYSTKLGLQGLRVCAGHSSERGLHFNQRTVISPPDDLRKAVNGFEFVESSLERVLQANAQDGKDRQTAIQFFKLIDNLRDVVLQDAAVLIARGRKHLVFDLPVFQTRAFKTFQEEILQSLAVTPHPQDDDLRRNIPAVADRLDNQQQEIGNVKRELGHLRNDTNRRLDSLNENMGTGFSLILTKMGEQMHRNSQQNHEVSRHLLQAAVALTGDPVEPQEETTTMETEIAGQTSIAEDISLPFTMHVRHASATSMYNEWYGLEKFAGKPIPGGIAAAEQLQQTAWRRHFTSAENKQFSRMKTVISAIDGQIKSGTIKKTVLEQFDCWFQQTGSLTALAKLVQEKGLVQRKRQKTR
jgi:hypothetical protein